MLALERIFRRRRCSLPLCFSSWVLAVMFNPFLAVVDLMGEGRVDLNVGFTFPLLFQVFHGGGRNCCACSYLVGERTLGDGIVVRVDRVVDR